MKNNFIHVGAMITVLAVGFRVRSQLIADICIGYTGAYHGLDVRACLLSVCVSALHTQE